MEMGKKYPKNTKMDYEYVSFMIYWYPSLEVTQKPAQKRKFKINKIKTNEKISKDTSINGSVEFFPVFPF